MSKVSVIITTYEGETQIERSVLSVLNQTFGDFELIVVDDNGLGTKSQVNTKKLLDKYIENGKLKYIPHEQNKNASVARNTGFNNSRGEYIMFLDDDDEFTPDRIEKQLSLLENTGEEYGVCYCSFEKYEKNGKFFERCIANKSGNLLYNVMMHRSTLSTGNMMIKRAAYENVGGFDESFKRHQDWEFAARLAEKYKVIAMKDVGLIIHLEFRSFPKNYDMIKQYRENYLVHMESQLSRLKPTQRRRVIAENRYDIAMYCLKKSGIKSFVREFKEIGIGYFGFEFLVRRFYHILRQRIQSKLFRF